MMLALSWQSLAAAFILDLLLGDPHRFPHPVRWMGNAISHLEPRFRTMPVSTVAAGTLFCVALVSGTFIVSLAALASLQRLAPPAAIVLEIILLYYCLSVRSLMTAATQVYNALLTSDLRLARRRVARIVGRETDRLSPSGVARATVETVAENFVDGVLSPLFFAAIGGAPLAMAFKMSSTLDSMVGYRNETYEKFGKASARLDDLLNFIPARLSVPLIALSAQLFGNRGRPALETAWKDGTYHASPNAGLPEAAFAGALGVRLGGPNVYSGTWVHKPYIGKKFRDVRSEDIPKACTLLLMSSLLAGCVMIVLSALLG